MPVILLTGYSSQPTSRPVLSRSRFGIEPIINCGYWDSVVGLVAMLASSSVDA